MDERSIARGMGLNHHHLDEDSAARLLQGVVHPDDAPPGYASVADLLAAAASAPAVDEDAGAATISAMVEAIRASGPVPEPARKRPRLGQLLAGKAMAAAAVVALTAGGAAAATGSLPDAVQGAVAEAVSHVGVDIPNPNDDNSAGHRNDGEHRQDAEHRPDGQSGDDGGPNHDANEDPNKGEVISGITHDPALEGEPKGPTVCTEASGGTCQAGDSNPGQGGGHETTPPTTGGPPENPGGGQGEPNDGAAGAGNGAEVTPPGPATRPDPATPPNPATPPDPATPPSTATTPTTGGIETGAGRSGREVGPSGMGQSAGVN